MTNRDRCVFKGYLYSTFLERRR